MDHPLGVGGEALHDWDLARNWRQMHGEEGGESGIDDDFAARGSRKVGACILGRNMFGAIRGPWPDMNWKGWWGKNPPFHVPVFVLTHHARSPIRMEGDTTFHFVTGGIHEALDQARKAADGMDVRIGGGPKTIQQYLRAGLIDELHVAIVPILLGGGERLFEGGTCGPWDTNASSSWGRRRPPMSCSGVRASDAQGANLMYVSVLTIGFIGAMAARFRAHGLSRASFATAPPGGVGARSAASRATAEPPGA